jgi:hypothetical protein
VAWGHSAGMAEQYYMLPYLAQVVANTGFVHRSIVVLAAAAVVRSAN